jgi:hypothetical protein
MSRVDCVEGRRALVFFIGLDVGRQELSNAGQKKLQLTYCQRKCT